jgi:hypothetical protein
MQSLSKFIKKSQAQSGGVTLIFVVMLSTVIMTSVSMSYVMIVNRAKYQARIKEAYKMQNVFEELARFLLRAREQYVQVSCGSPAATCASIGGTTVATINYAPITNMDANYPLGMCWAPPISPTGSTHRWATGTATDTTRNTCFGVYYLNQFFCMARPSISPDDRINTSFNDSSSFDFSRIAELGDMESYIKKNYIGGLGHIETSGSAPAGFLAVASRLVTKAYAVGGINFGSTWAPPAVAADVQLGIRPPSVGLGSAGGYGDMDCALGAGGAARTCMTLSVCPPINGGQSQTSNECTHSNQLNQVRIRFVSREARIIRIAVPAENVADCVSGG